VPSPDKINEYLIRICEQVRWREIRPRIETELRDHILDQRDAYMSKGLNEDAATERAIAETGDAAMLGSQFDRAHRPPQKSLLAVTFTLLAIGLLTRRAWKSLVDKFGKTLYYYATRYIAWHNSVCGRCNMSYKGGPMTEAMYYVLLALMNPSHGYRLMHEIAEASQGRVRMGPGTLYGVLTRMENDGLISVALDDGRRKVYRITQDGTEALDAEYRRLRAMVRDGEAIGGAAHE